ncbi:MAG: inorganic phosphate transporter [Paracoccus sp. (in: a-proteobacteria)]
MFITMLQRRDFHILDKDLARLTHAEGASRVAARPLRRGGLVLGLILLALLAGAIAGIGVPAEAPVIAGFSVAIYLGLNIGANDVANSVGPASGARALPVGTGLAIVALAQLAGALLAGEAVTATIAREILPAGRMSMDVRPAQIMTSALIGAALWITLANWARAPVSTTHSIVGAIAGAGMAGAGPHAISWGIILGITLSWMIAPLIAAMIAALVLGLVRWRVHFTRDRIAAARVWLPALIGMTAMIFTLYLVSLSGQPALTEKVMLISAGPGLLSGLLARWHLERQIIAQGRDRLSLKDLLTVPLIVTTILSGFAHGANDVANIAGPLSILLENTVPGTFSLRIIALAAISVAAGSLIFGRRLVRLVGTSITRLNPIRAFCAALAAAATVLACSALGIPVSTTHCAVGGIFGVGFYREWEDRWLRKSRKTLPTEEMQRRRLVRRSHVWTSLAAWAVTVPGAGMAAAATYGLLSLTH